MAFTGNNRIPRCCGQSNNFNIPAPLQNLVIFELTGYNYRTLPQWFDETGQKMIALQAGIEFNKLKYIWSFYKREGDLCHNTYHLSTSDDIFPTIHDVVSGNKMKVNRMDRHNGYTSWKITC